MNMNRNQWFTFAIGLFLISMFLLYFSSSQTHNANMLFTPDMSVVGSNLYNALIVKGAVYGSLGVLCFGFGFIFLFSGYLEKKP